MSSKFHGKWRIGLLISGLLVALVAADVFFHVGAPSKAGATVALRPATASVGSTILVTGSHFPPQERVKVYFQNRDRGIIRAVTNANGSFSVPLTVPLAYVPGDRYYVYVNSDVYHTQLVFHFAKPGISLTDSTAQPTFGSSTSFTGKGFRPGEQVNLAWNCAAGSMLSAGTVVAGTDGNFNTLLIIPSIPYAAQCRLVATGYISDFTASVAITSAPGLLYDPSSASAGMMVTIRGGSFASGELVKVTFDGSPVATVKTDASGAFTTSFLVPNSGPPGYQGSAIVATGLVSGAQAKGGFRKEPKITLAPNHGGSGTHIRVSGTDFTPDGVVKIYFIVNEESLAIIRTLETTVVASSNGTFSVTITAPGLLEDVNSIVVVDVKTNGTASATFFSNDGNG